ncbi:MAG: Cellulose biosynthesis protein BcsQ [Candidatus Electronema aureum]|uniref:Cellulose biosynthesis protein BcsQ n=1 Tax=Candidatus Electronema aureum TaxID=2005002 RepID=A0A521G589_9BACT|nr:MAG: Cellulose biosynthesis protein BcsQ [Candidatus Electronema aureum]
MSKIISIFNNKGGVGKTTFVYHLAYALEAMGKKVLLVDGDPQCSLSIHFLTDSSLESSWKPEGRSIYRMVEPLLKGTGDIRTRAPWRKIGRDIYMYPGDVLFGDYEEELSNAWVECLAGRERGFRITTAIYRIVQQYIQENEIDFVFFDLGPNLGSLTRSLLLSSDYFISPMIPDAFSIRATENFGKKLREWSILWQDARTRIASLPFPVPNGKPKFIGYVTQMFNVYRNESAKFWQPWVQSLPVAIKNNIVDVLDDVNGYKLIIPQDNYEIGEIKSLSSLIPLAQTKRMPVHELAGLKGTQHSNAISFKNKIQEIATRVDQLTS